MWEALVNWVRHLLHEWRWLRGQSAEIEEYIA
jgi:hypothetical protein